MLKLVREPESEEVYKKQKDGAPQRDMGANLKELPIAKTRIKWRMQYWNINPKYKINTQAHTGINK